MLDPWMGTGHTNDISLTTPCFRDDVLVGFLACNSHVMDIGGLVDRGSSTGVFMEGLYLPILKIVEAGGLNELLMAVMRANNPPPGGAGGDVYSLVNRHDVGFPRFLEM